jgi:GR25 family glycosyltransferase involved in LPS biosynthesis
VINFIGVVEAILPSPSRMARNTLLKWFIPVLVLLIVASVFYYRTTPSIDDIWVLNLDKDKERFQAILDQESLLPQKVNRWKATYGKEETRVAAEKDGVNHVLSKSADVDLNKRNPNIIHIPGEIGCWLSHKRLLRHLNTLNVSPNFGHLILEDDVLIDKNFLQKWERVKQSIPGDWDFIYLGIRDMLGERINENVVRWKNTAHWGNIGTHAYMVRHRALPHILNKLKYMNAPIDVQYYNMLGDLNIYILDPQLISPNEGFESTIDAQQKRY